GGTIRCILGVAAGQDGPQATISVRDSGPGVPAELREAIFERFRQGDDGATRPYSGTGLGLAIVKEFVALHGGRVAVAMASEGGADFTVALPLSAPAGVAVDGAPSAPAIAAESSALDPIAGVDAEERDEAPNPERLTLPLILVVEDNRDMRRFIVETLSDEYRVAT